MFFKLISEIWYRCLGHSWLLLILQKWQCSNILLFYGTLKIGFFEAVLCLQGPHPLCCHHHCYMIAALLS